MYILLMIFFYNFSGGNDHYSYIVTVTVNNYILHIILIATLDIL